MSEAAKKIPTTREELTFKVIETYEKILSDCTGGLITLAQADYAVKTLIAATGWGVDKDTFKELSSWEVDHDSSFFERRIFSNDKHYFQVLKAPTLSSVLIFRGKVKVKGIRCDNTADLGDLFDKVCAKMKKDGYREFEFPNLGVETE